MTKSCVYRDLLHLPYMTYIDVLNNMVIYTDSLYVYAFMSLVYPKSHSSANLESLGLNKSKLLYMIIKSALSC